MPQKIKPNVEEQLALYRLQKKQEEKRRAFKQRLWNTFVTIITLGTRAQRSSDGTHDNSSEIGSVKMDSQNSSKEVTSKEMRRRAGQSSNVSSSASTDFNDEDLQTSSFMFYATYTTLDWVALGLKCLMWLLLFKVFILIEFGAVFFIFSAFIFIWFTLRSEPKKKGEISAYSVFNPDCKAIDGSYTAEQFERELLHKM